MKVYREVKEFEPGFEESSVGDSFYSVMAWGEWKPGARLTPEQVRSLIEIVCPSANLGTDIGRRADEVPEGINFAECWHEWTGVIISVNAETRTVGCVYFSGTTFWLMSKTFTPDSQNIIPE